MWHAPAEALERDTYRVRRLCWTFQTPEAPKDVAFTVSLYTPTVVPAPDDPTLNETQPLRPAVHTAQFTATVGTAATVVSVDLDYETREPVLFVGLRWDVCAYADELQNVFHDERPDAPFYHYTGDDDTWLYSPIAVALRVQTNVDAAIRRALDAELDNEDDGDAKTEL